MASLKERASAVVRRARERSRFLDHLLSMVAHYGDVDGSGQAGAVTYFGFLSFFPILALAFFVIGYVATVYPAARDQLISALGSVLPGLIGPQGVHLSAFTHNAGTVGIIGVIGLLYSGLGWLSGMRKALDVLFVMPDRALPNFVLGKLRDLIALIMIGVVLVVSVALSGAVANFNQRILRLIGIDPHSLVPNGILWIVGHLLGIAASAVLLMAIFKLLSNPPLPAKSMWAGAVIGAVGFEILKSLATFLIANTKSQPAFQAFGVALVLVVWINYFSRLVMYAAAWAYTSPEAREARIHAATRAPGAALSGNDGGREEPPAGEAAGATARTAAEPQVVWSARAGDRRGHRGQRRRARLRVPVLLGALAVAAGAARTAHRRIRRG
ncbi:MAG TPA: YihY/virulence factor BrkB family protein [Nocardioidaceae bacterium]|nr:YihY/virulence factor BrkB family protein [Nocardioidaceae bacterium]